MNRTLQTAATAAALALIGVAALSGCGTGQISQTANQASAVNGTGGVVGNLALRNVLIRSAQDGGAIAAGKTVDLEFQASNQSAEGTDSLTGIRTAIGKVTVHGDTALPAGGSLVAGTPAGQDQATVKAMQQLRGGPDARPVSAGVALDKPISNGLTYDFTFEFAKAGSITLAVPIAAGTAPQPVMVVGGD